MEIKWSELASRQLGDIVEYVGNEYGRTVALRTLDKITSKVQGLLKFPESGRLDREYSTKTHVVRHVLAGPNIIYYFVDNDVIEVMLLAHCKMSNQKVVAMIKRFLEHYEK